LRGIVVARHDSSILPTLDLWPSLRAILREEHGHVYLGMPHITPALPVPPPVWSLTRMVPDASTATPMGSVPRGPWAALLKSLSSVRVPVAGSTRNSTPRKFVPA
jgi:hypothetical protein